MACTKSRGMNKTLPDLYYEVNEYTMLVNASLVMAAPVILILSDSSKDSVGSHVPRVILFGTIPTSIHVIHVVSVEVPITSTDPLVTPEVGAVSVISPTGMLDLVDYSSSADSDPSEDSLPLAPEWRDRVASRPSSPPGSSSHDTLAPSSEFPLVPVVAPFGIRRRPAILRVGPFPARRLAWRRVSHRSSDHHSSPDSTSDSSSSGLSLDSSSDTSLGTPLYSILDSSSVHSSGCDTLGQTHSGPSTIVASPRSAPLSIPYPSTSLESSLDSSPKRLLDSSLPSAGPSRKRCKSPTTLAPSSILVSRSIAPIHADLLPPRKRFRDSYSPEGSREEHMEIGTADVEAVADLGIGDRVGAHTEDGIGIGVEISASDIREDKEKFEAEASTRGTIEIVVDPLVTGGISESTRGDLIASRERAGLADKVRRLGRENLRVRALLCIERDRVDNLRHHMALSQEKFCQIHRDRDDARRRLRRLELLVERRLGFRP
ncbi:hypothetical protein Tco_0687700 [Tanacetum coccineum]